MNPRIIVFCSLLATLALTACGQSGALYLPDQAPVKKRPQILGPEPAAVPPEQAPQNSQPQPAPTPQQSAPAPVPPANTEPVIAPAPTPANNQETP